MRCVCPLSLILTLCAAGPASQPAESTDPKVILQKIKSDADAAREDIEYRPSLGEKRWDEALVLDYNGPALTARTQLSPTFRGRSLTITGETGICLAELRFNRMGTPMFFYFKRVDTTDPDYPSRITDLSATPGHTQLNQTLTSIAQTIFVQLVDDRINPDKQSPHPNGECRLYIDISNTSTEAQMYHKQVFEADLPALLWSHRALCDQFVRPMLRDLGQERLMRIDTSVARQVLAGQSHKPADSAVSDEVRELVQKLDSDDFKERKSASEKLKDLGLPGAQAMLELDRAKLTPEQRNRVNEIIDANHPVKPADIERFGNDPAFLIDCLELDDHEVIDAALARLQRSKQKKPDFDPKADPAEQTKELDALRHQLLPWPTTRPS
jgi:hypothetical protein